MNILYIGPLRKGGTCLQRMFAIQDLGHTIIPVDTDPISIHNKQFFLYRIKKKIFGPSDLVSANHKIITLVKKHQIDVLWLDKALTISPKTLGRAKKINPRVIIVGYSPDDMINKQNQSRHFLKGLPFYDCYFTTKSYGVKELCDLGCKKVFFIGNSFDSNTHFPRKITAKNKNQFGSFRWIYIASLSILLTLGTTSCDSLVEVIDPDIVTPESLNSRSEEHTSELQSH